MDTKEEKELIKHKFAKFEWTRFIVANEGAPCKTCSKDTKFYERTHKERFCSSFCLTKFEHIVPVKSM